MNPVSNGRVCRFQGTAAFSGDTGQTQPPVASESDIRNAKDARGATVPHSESIIRK
jgi:hypothetical protein